MTKAQIEDAKKRRLANLACKKKRGSKSKGRDGLTLKEAKLVANRAKGMSNHEAYRDAYETTSTNKSAMTANASNILSKPRVKEALENALERKGVTVDYIVGNAKNLFEESEKPNDQLQSLKFLAELARLTGATAVIDPTSPKTVNILNVRLDKLKETELMDMLLNAKRK